MGSDNEEEKKQVKETEYKTDQTAANVDIPDKNTAFQIFKQEYPPVKDFELEIVQTSDKLKKYKEEAKEYLDLTENYKAKIEQLKNFLNDKKITKYNEAVRSYI
jgi:hypothetical protein